MKKESMKQVVLVTGASTGIGNLTARSLADAGHTVYASMRNIGGRNAGHAEELLEYGRSNGLDLRGVELDVQSEASAEAAVATILREAGKLDVVVHNAGHLVVGYVEAFTPKDIEHLFDVNAIGIQRVNRAVLPHMRERRSGTLVYVGSTTSVVVPPFMGPYVASKFAADAIAQVTAYEVGQFGIETTIVMPGPFTQGTDHFPNASRASDVERSSGYAALDPLVKRNEEATSGLFTPGVDAHPKAVGEEIARILALPEGTRPFRSVVDFTNAGVEEVNEAARRAQENFMNRLGFGELLHIKTAQSAQN
ncbi:SDR family NAD(P)-dependent oxidoreductase [Paenibacillus sp. DXFW5]|uniref:SDR family NAD(P)-dependent oxidoreductase n=1 Tax=Paenibacillus rhizolycopersici TaxID=2780073 RepID=A0ABS2HD28_9BACL|nr:MULTISPECIES: SDR family NAD(P)-dependent oxidoreductase [Paenibacillus]MBM6997785.1 SDR family NAD(P)-dependent oxidoreductase [Paenibacillus rhizolycopersici]GIP47526.1 short-chain dehydrogenase/reductase [Paenibacillus sp. J53TS2]